MLKLYNTLTRKKEIFKPQKKKIVKFYSCGPTVYDYAHIGNLAAYLFADLLHRYLEFKNYQVKRIINITDVGHLTADDINQADSGEDKMLRAALRERKTPSEIACFYTKAFLEDSKKLNLKKANFYPKASRHIKEMIEIIKILIKKGLAYEKNGNVFFNVRKFKSYGKLSGKKLAELKQGARLEKHPDKKNPFDFALWLKAPQEHLLKWKSPWSIGYPGWHIECSAMSMKYLGTTLDIHSGGEDHIFPHHENEIAQSEGYTGKKFVRFWFHNRFILVDGRKMSKSKGNFYTLSDIVKKGLSPMAFRLLILSSHYRSNLNFVWPALKQAQKNFDKIQEFIFLLKEEIKKQKRNKKIKSKVKNNKKIISQFFKNFEKALDDDLNSPLALSKFFNFIEVIKKKIVENQVSLDDLNEINKIWKKVNFILGLKLNEKSFQIPKEIIQLAKQREKLRKEKKFKEADEKRKLIEQAGYKIEDTFNGFRIIPQLSS